MDPATIALVCATVFGVIGILSAFIRQLLLSREKRLNDAAQLRALQQETYELDKIRQQMSNDKRFESYYSVLGDNKEAVEYIDHRIEDILNKKSQLIQRYADAALRESSAIVAGDYGPDCKIIIDKLKADIDSEVQFYNNELEILQKRRASLWGKHIRPLA